MSWLATLPYLAGIMLFLGLPGAFVLRAAGIRGLGLFALAVPVTTTIAAVGAVLLGLLGLPYSVLSMGVVTFLVAIAALLARFALALRATDITEPAPPTTPAPSLMDRLSTGRWGLSLPLALIYLAVAAVPALLIFYRYAHGIGNVERVSQTFDNIFHLNAVRSIIDRADGSSLTLGNLTPLSQSFYPAAWHDLVALVAMQFNLSIPAAVNMTNIVVACFVWPLATMFLITRITGPRLLPLALTAVILPTFPAFPYLMMSFGVLYPNHLAIAMIPAGLALILQALNLTQAEESTVQVGCAGLVLMLPGLALAHPSALLALFIFSLPFMVAKLWFVYLQRHRRPRGVRSLAFFSLVMAAYLIIGGAMWMVARPAASASSIWTATQSPAQATGEALANTPGGLPGGGLMFIFTVTGLLVVFMTRRQRWLAGTLAIGILLYVISVAYDSGDFRNLMTGIWYNDYNRLASLLPVVAAPIVVLGAEYLIRWVVRFIMNSEHYSRLAAEHRFFGYRSIISASMVLALVAATGVSLQSGAITAQQSRFTASYTYDASSPLLSPDERMLLDRVPSHVPEDNVVVASPWTGASLVYAISDRRTTRPHVYGRILDEYEYVMDHWAEAAYSDEACRVVRETKAFYAVDFGPVEVFRGRHPIPGLADLERAGGVELVDQQGDAKLYRLTSCR